MVETFLHVEDDEDLRMSVSVWLEKENGEATDSIVLLESLILILVGDSRAHQGGDEAGGNSVELHLDKGWKGSRVDKQRMLWER